MKILHVVEALGGGVYTYFNGLSSFFSQDEITKEHETIIIYNDKRNEIIPEKIKEDFGSKVELIKVEMVKNLNPIKDLKSTYQLAKLIRQINPDVVHLHSSKAGVIGRWASFISLKKHKLFYTPHGYSFLRKDLSKNSKSILKNIEKYTQTFFGGTTIACGDTEFEIAKTLGKALMIRNGINLSELEKKSKGSTNKTLTFGLVGRITFARNPTLFNEIALRFPYYNFIWIGDGDLNAQITAPNIEITGWMFNSDEVYEQLNRIDVILQTSLWEGLPIALLEALAFRKPIIATNIIGNKDIVVHGVNGFLFENIEELKPYFKQLENEKTRVEMGKNAFEICKNKFDNEKNFNSLIQIYSS